MIEVKKHGVILEPTKLKFENQAVLNPGCIKKGNYVHMFYRAVRKGNHSTIGYCKLKGPLDVVKRLKRPIIKPKFDYEKQGVEDARIVKLGRMYYLTYVGFNGRDAVSAYAVSNDLKHFKKKGLIFPVFPYHAAIPLFKNKKRYDYFNLRKIKKHPEEHTYIWGKDIVLFPKKIKGKYALLHRVLPDIPIAYFKKFSDLTPKFWENQIKNIHKRIVLKAKYKFETGKLGAGCPPIETKKGWLLIFHTTERTKTGEIYRAGAALLDKKNPQKVLGRLNYPLFSPEKKWELKGDVNNVVFPSGAAIFDGRLYMYYGAADKRIAAASVDVNELLDELSK